MAIEIDFSVMSTSQKQLECVRRHLDTFEARSGIHVNLQPLDWNTGRSELVNMALYRHGADVSDVGSTWIGDFIAMNALRPFTTKEIDVLGGEAAFVPAAWQAGIALGDIQVWAIPWVVSSIVIGYRKDLFQQAGVDEKTAFKTYAKFEHTLDKLKASGLKMPLALPIRYSRYSTLHNVVSWIWGVGSNLLSPDGKRVVFDQPEALEAMKMYYGLHRYLPSELFKLTEKTISPRLLWDGQAAMAISGSWIAGPRSTVPLDIRSQLGTALLPGPSFVGAQNLVIWKHSRNPKAALELVGYLSQAAVQGEYAERLSLMPSRIALLEAPPFTDNPNLKVAAQAARTGRSFTTMRLLGLIEDRLSLGLEFIWNTIIEKPDSDLDMTIRNIIIPLAQRLNLTLGS